MKKEGKEVVKEIVDFIRNKCNIAEEDVAILIYDPGDRVLKFLYPPDLVDAGTIPINSPDSLAARVFNSGKSFLSNNFQDVRHLSFFTKFTKDKRPLLKIMAVPIFKGGKPIGVIEVSSREPTRNFTEEELLSLEQIGELIGEKFEVNL